MTFNLYFDPKIDPVDQMKKCWWPSDITALFVTYNLSKYGIRKIVCFCV